MRAAQYNLDNPSRRNAFTLVEILAVLVIMGVAAAMVIPRIGNRDDLKTASAARVVMANLIFAQNRAISLQKTQYVKFDVANKTFSVIDTPAPLAYVTDPVTLANAGGTFGNAGSNGLVGVTLTSANFDGQTTIAFDELGTPHAYNFATGATTAMVNTGTIVLRAGTTTLTISVEPYSGEITAN